MSQKDYTDDLRILVESVSKMNEPLEVLRVQGARTGLKTNVKKILICWTASLTLVVLLVKTVGAVKMLKVE